MIRKIPLLLFLLIVMPVLPVMAENIPEPMFELFDPGEEIIDYEKYGEFQGRGGEDYKFKVKDRRGLAAAAGEGIYPNSRSLAKSPGYKQYKKQKKLEGSHWLYVNSPDYQANFYRWATAAEDPGVKLFYTGLALENAGHLKHAIKAYHAVAVNFPRSVGWTYWQTPWYIGTVALDRILFLTRKYPELGLKLVDARITVKNRFDDDVRNDVYIVNPGRLVKVSPEEVIGKLPDLSRMKVLERKNFGKISFVNYENGHWQMLLNGKPTIIKAVAYQPTRIGESPDVGTLTDWTVSDFNENGRIDSPYDSWVDENGNNQRDKGEDPIGDFQLMKDLGVDALRIYHHTQVQNKELLKRLYEDFGIMVMMGDYLGMYAVGSQAPWNVGTDYSNLQQQRNMIESVMRMVHEYKDESYVMAWILGNENNYGTANNSRKDPRAYYRFVNQVAKKIKEVDPNHPVLICNGDIQFLDIFAEECPDVDVFGANSYRGKAGFGDNSFWYSLREVVDRPVFITEFGCPAYGRDFSWDYAEQFQAEYLVNNWKDMEFHRAGGPGTGLSIGGGLFEFLDEWWKAGAPPGYPDIIQDVTPNATGPFVDGWFYEEWFGIVGQGDGTDSPFMRNKRRAYFEIQKLWSEDQ